VEKEVAKKKKEGRSMRATTEALTTLKVEVKINDKAKHFPSTFAHRLFGVITLND